MKQLKILLLTSMVTFFSAYGMDVNVTGNAVQPIEVIVDNQDSEFSTTGTWSESGASDEYAESSVYSKNINARAIWTPVLAEAGSYEVYVWYAGSTYSRDTNADYTVNYSGGSETIVIDQNEGSGDWVSLGVFSLNAGSSANVTLVHDDESGASTSADAVKFVFVPDAEAVQQGHVKDSRTGNGLADVKVSIGESSTTTDLNGYYTLSDLAENDKAVVNFEKEGYLLGSTKIQIKELFGDNTPSTNYLEYSMYAHDYQWNHDSTEEILSSGIDIDASVSYVDANGNPYNGTMAVKLTILDNDEDALLNSFPGSFEGINTNGEVVPFVSYGLISLSFKDTNGNILDLTNNTGATLTFNAITSSEEQNIIPLWYYDYGQGVWIEEGYAELQTDNTYKGDISHSGTWSMNKPIETDPGIYRGRIIDEDGSPISDVRLQAIGDNWINNDLSTDENGVFEIKVIPGKTFQLSAYNYKDNYKASYDSTLAAIASGNIVED